MDKIKTKQKTWRDTWVLGTRHSFSRSVHLTCQLLLTERVISSLDFKYLIKAKYLGKHCQKMPNFECKKL